METTNPHPKGGGFLFKTIFIIKIILWEKL